MASLKIACITVGEQITAEQLIEKRIIMKKVAVLRKVYGGFMVPVKVARY